MTYMKLVALIGATFAILNGFISVHGYTNYDLIDEVVEASQGCKTNLTYITGRRTDKLKYGIQQLCTEYINTSKIETKKTLFIDLENLSWVRLNGWYRN